ncbi:type VII secretion integral membrane protein EccD [Streptomyces sp. NPDC087226]|uniref:type VII secretion integral membrane protein EccD n=1 Tax=Streptomyces sp. NPDC087226 TaxID=3365771 RepID=UPI0038113937
MENERCHVTVVGTRRRVDLAVPADAAIAAYTPALLELVGQGEFDETFPPVWSLALPGSAPFPPEASLRESGVLDGATLYLRDAAAGESDEPVVTDLEETVENTRSGMTGWGRRPRAYTTLVLAVLSLVATFTMLAWTHRIPSVTGSGAVGVALALALLAWYATRQDWSLPLRLRLFLAHSAVPLLAVAAAVLPVAGTGVSAALVAISAGTVLGALAALLAVRHATTLAATGAAVLFLLLTLCLVLGDATVREASAVVVLVMALVLALAPKFAGHVAVMAGPPTGGADPLGDEEDVRHMVRRGQRLLVAANTLASLLAAACLVVLGTADQPFAAGLAVCLGLALVLRAGQVTIAPAVVPVVAAGTVALVATALRAPGNFGAPPWSGPVALLGAALLALVVGLGRALRTEDTGDRPSWLDPLGGFLLVLSLPLAVGVFGVYEALLTTGQAR